MAHFAKRIDIHKLSHYVTHLLISILAFFAKRSVVHNRCQSKRVVQVDRVEVVVVVVVKGTVVTCSVWRAKVNWSGLLKGSHNSSSMIQITWERLCTLLTRLRFRPWVTLRTALSGSSASKNI